MQVLQRENPLALGSDRGESSIPVGTRLFHHESLVRYYTFVEQMATGNVAHHWDWCYIPGILVGKIAP